MGAIDGKKVIYIGLAVIAVLVAVYWYGSRDNGPGADAVRTNISATGDQQQRAKREIGESQQLADEVRTTNQSAVREIEGSRVIGKSSAELIAEGAGIAKSVRARDEARKR